MTDEQRQAYHRARYIKDREKIKAQAAAWQAANPERHRAYSVAYRNKPSTKAKTSEYNKRYYLTNKEIIAARRRKVKHERGVIGA